MGVFAAYATTDANLVLVVELAIGAVLIAGLVVVRTGHVRAHRYLQSSMVLVNIPIVLAWMVPSYLTNVAHHVGSELSQSMYYLPVAMLVLGVAAEVLGVYIVLVAGTNWLPERLRFRRYKLWMRTELGLWWAVLLLGLATYYVWYTPT
jgi:uncharacterized membrane protein YozB (DUF420 family)